MRAIITSNSYCDVSSRYTSVGEGVMKAEPTSTDFAVDFSLLPPIPQQHLFGDDAPLTSRDKTLTALWPVRLPPEIEGLEAGTSRTAPPMHSPFVTPYKAVEDIKRTYVTPSRSVLDGDMVAEHQSAFEEVVRQPQGGRTDEEETSTVQEVVCMKSAEQVKREKIEEMLHLPLFLLQEEQSLSNILKLTAEGRVMLVALEEGRGMAFKPNIRQELVHIMADRLQQHCLESLDILHATLYARHLLRPFPNVDLSLFVGKATSPLPRRLAVKRKKLHMQGLHKLRPYKRKKDMEEVASAELPANDDELLRLADRINDVTRGTTVYYGLVERTRNFRLRFASRNPPSETFRVLPFFALDAHIVVGDYCATVFDGKRDKIEWWKEFDGLWTDLLLSRAVLSIPKDRQEELASIISECRQVRAVLAAIELLSQSTCKKKAKPAEARLEFLYQNHPTASDPMQIVRSLNGSHPIIFRIGTTSAHYIAYAGIPIQLTYSLGHAILALLSIYYIFPAKFPNEISAVLSLFERMLGVPSLKRCTTADSLYAVLLSDRPAQDEA